MAATLQPLDTVPSDIRKKAAERVRQMTASKRSWAKDNIDRYTEYLKEQARKIASAEEEAKKEVSQWMEAQARLKKARVKFITCTYDLDIIVKTKKSRMGDIYKAIGRLDGANKSVDIEDAKKNLVRVTLTSVHFPNVRVSFVRKLTKSDPCKIEEVEIPARVEYRLVCESPKKGG